MKQIPTQLPLEGLEEKKAVYPRVSKKLKHPEGTGKRAVVQRVNVGDKFGRLTIVKIFKNIGSHLMVECICDCGNRKTTRARSLEKAVTRSCGCLASEGVANRNFVHGETINKPSPEWTAWHMMKQRCYNEHVSCFYRYGGRGISVCKRWISSFEAFLEDMGYKPFPKAQLDRINNDGNYEPSNCRWVTAKQNSNNRSSSKRVEDGNPTVVIENGEVA
jgi:hypothetical protein